MCVCPAPVFSLFVAQCIFKVAVLNQFSIQSSIGGVVNIFKKSSQQHVADPFWFVGLYSYGCLYFFQPFKMLSILFCYLTVQNVFVLFHFVGVYQFFDNCPCYIMQLPCSSSVG